MKNLLVPTDLSEVSINALDYAMNMAVAMDAKVTILHVHQPMPVSIDGFTMGDLRIEEAVQVRFDAFIQKIKSTYQGNEVVISHQMSSGFSVDRILQTAKDIDAYMIVMGTTGEGWMKKLLGSISTEVMKVSDIPVLLIPPQTKYRILKKVVFADDFTNNHDKGLIYLQDLLSEFLFSVDCVHITTDKEPNHEWVDLSIIENRYAGIKFNQIELNKKSILTGLMEYSREHNVDMIIAPSHKKGFAFHLFFKSVTREMAVATTLPLLIIH